MGSVCHDRPPPRRLLIGWSATPASHQLRDSPLFNCYFDNRTFSGGTLDREWLALQPCARFNVSNCYLAWRNHPITASAKRGGELEQKTNRERGGPNAKEATANLLIGLNLIQ